MNMEPELLKREAGVSGSLQYTPLQVGILSACSAIAWAYTVELDLLILYTFRRRTGLYFWSLLISSWGCSMHAVAFILKFLVGSSWLIYTPFIEVGWVGMVTGQAFVLFSRLHLVVRNRKTLRLVLFVIIFNVFALHLPTIVMTVGSNSPNAAFWVPKFNIMERIQLMGFCLQEFFISTLYIVATVRLLGSIYHSMTRRVMIQLLLVNGICIGMDVILIGLEFSGQYISEASIKPMIYAIKLKLEFTVLNQLMGLTKAGFTEENQFRGSARHQYHQGGTHELHPSRGGGNMGSVTGNDAESGLASPKPQGKSGTWSSARALRGSFAHGDAAQQAARHPDLIFQTKQVEITSSPKSPVLDTSDSQSGSTIAPPHPVSSTAPLPPPQASHAQSHSHGPKVNSLMGTAIVHMPNADRRSRQVDPDGREGSPVSEGEKGILGRLSQDSDKEGTRWIDGLDHR